MRTASTRKAAQAGASCRLLPGLGDFLGISARGFRPGYGCAAPSAAGAGEKKDTRLKPILLKSHYPGPLDARVARLRRRAL